MEQEVLQLVQKGPLSDQVRVCLLQILEQLKNKGRLLFQKKLTVNVGRKNLVMMGKLIVVKISNSFAARAISHALRSCENGPMVFRGDSDVEDVDKRRSSIIGRPVCNWVLMKNCQRAVVAYLSSFHN